MGFGDPFAPTDDNELLFQSDRIELNYEILANANPWLATQPDLINDLATSGLDPYTLQTSATRILGDQHADRLFTLLPTLNESTQRSIFSTLTNNAQMSLWEMGYEVPDGYEENWIDAGLSAVNTVVGTALGGVARLGSKIPGAGAVAGPFFNGLMWLSDQPARLYRTWRQMEPWEQAVMAASFVAGAGGVYAGARAGMAGRAILGSQRAGQLVGSVGSQSAAFGRTSVAGLMTTGGLTTGSLTGLAINPSGYVDAFQAAADGERLFNSESKQLAERLSYDETVLSIARDVAVFLPRDEFVAEGPALVQQIAQEIAGVRDSTNQSMYTTAAQRFVAEHVVEASDPAFVNYVQAFDRLLREPKFREIVQTYQNGKISPGRDAARLLGFKAGDANYSFVSAAVDAVWVWTLDPFLLSTPAFRHVRYASRTIDDVGTPIIGSGWGFRRPPVAGENAVMRRINMSRENVRGLQGVDDDIVAALNANNSFLLPRQYESSWDAMREYFRRNEFIGATGEIKKTITREDLYKFYMDADGVRLLAQGLGQIPGLPQAVVSTRRNVLNQNKLRQTLRDVRIGLTNPDFERSIAAIAKKSGVDIDELRLANDVSDNLGLDYKIPEGGVADDMGTAGTLAGEALAKIGVGTSSIGDGRRSLGNFVDSVATMANTEPYVVLWGEGAEQSIRQVVSSMGATARMPFAVRESRIATILAQNTPGARRIAMLGFLDEFFNVSGMKYSERGAKLYEEFVGKFRQGYGYGGTDELLTANRSEFATRAGLQEIDQAPLLAVPPIKLLTRAVRNEHYFNRIMEITNDGAFLDEAMGIWRPAVLLRIGFVPRAAGEELLAWLARGTQGNVMQELFARRVARYEDMLELRRQIEQGVPMSQLPPDLRRMTDRRTFKYVYPEVENLLTQSGAEVGRLRRVAGRAWNPVADMLVQNWVSFIRDLRKFKGVPAIKQLLRRTDNNPFLQTLLFGRKNSWSYFGANGIDPAFVLSARRFTDKHAATFSRTISASSHNEYNLRVGEPEQSYMVVQNGNSTPIVRTAVGGVRQRIPSSSDAARVAYHQELSKPLANPEMGRVLATHLVKRPPLGSKNWDGAALANTLRNFDSMSVSEKSIMLELSMFEPDRWRIVELDMLDGARRGNSQDAAIAEAMSASYTTGDFNIDTFVESLRSSGDVNSLFINEVEQFWNLVETFDADGRGYVKALLAEQMMAPTGQRLPLQTLAGATEGVPNTARRVYIGKAGGINSYTINVDEAGNLVITPTPQYQWRGRTGQTAISTSVNPLHSASYALGSIVSDQPAYLLGNVFELDADFLMTEFGTTFDDVIAQPTTYNRVAIDPPQRGAYLMHTSARTPSLAEEIAFQPNHPWFAVIPDEPASVGFNILAQNLLQGRHQVQQMLPDQFFEAYANMSRIVDDLENRITERYIQSIRAGAQQDDEFVSLFASASNMSQWLDDVDRATLREALLILAQTESVSDDAVQAVRNTVMTRLEEIPEVKNLEVFQSIRSDAIPQSIELFGDAKSWVSQYDRYAREGRQLSDLINAGVDLTNPDLVARLDAFIDEHIKHVLGDVKYGRPKYTPGQPWDSWDGPFNELRRQFQEAGFNFDGTLNTDLYRFVESTNGFYRLVEDPEFRRLYAQRNVVIPAGKWRGMQESELLDEFALIEQHPDIRTGTGSLINQERGEAFIDQLLTYPSGPTGLSTVTERVFGEIKKIADSVENVNKPAINNIVARINAALADRLSNQGSVRNIMFDGNTPSLETLNYAWFDPTYKADQRRAWSGQMAQSSDINEFLISEGIPVARSVDDVNDRVIEVIEDVLREELGDTKYQRLLAYLNLRGDDLANKRSLNSSYLYTRLFANVGDTNELVTSPLFVADALTSYLNGNPGSDFFNLELLLSDALDETTRIVKDEYFFTRIQGAEEPVLQNIVNRWMNYVDPKELEKIKHGRFLSELPETERLAAMLLMRELTVPSQIGTRPFNGMDNITEIERMFETHGFGTLPRRTDTIHTSGESLRDQLIYDYTAALYRPENQDIVNASVFNVTTNGQTVVSPVPSGIERYYFPELVDGTILEEELRLLIQNSPSFAYDLDFLTAPRISADQIPDELVSELSARLLIRNQSSLAKFNEFVRLPMRQQIGLLEPFVRQAIAMPSAVGQVLNRTGVGNSRLAEFVTRAIGGLDADTPLAGMHQIDIGTSALDSVYPDAEVAKRRANTTVPMVDVNRTAIDRIQYTAGNILPTGEVGVSREAGIRNWAENAIDSVMHLYTKGSRETYTVQGEVWELLASGEFRQVPEGTVITEYGRNQFFDAPDVTANPVDYNDRSRFAINLETSDELQWSAVGPMIADYYEGATGRRRIVPFDSVSVADGQILPDADFVPVKHSKVSHIDFIDKHDRPNVIQAREYVIDEPQKVKDWTHKIFNDVFGPMIDGIIRTPMAFDNYHNAFIRNLTYMDALLTSANKTEIAALRSIVDPDVFNDLLRSYTGRLTDSNASIAATLQAFDFIDDDVLFAFRNNGLSFDEVKTAIEYDVLVQVNGGQNVPARYMDMIRDARNDVGRTYTLVPRRFPEGIDPVAIKEMTQEQVEALAAARRNLDFIDDISMQRAVNDTVPFIDSSSKRSLFSVRASNFMPFWYAEENFIKRWIRGAAQGMYGVDQIVKAQYLYNGLKNVGVLQEENGQLYFVYPGSVLLNQMISMVIPGAGLEDTGSAVRSPAESLLPGINPDAGRPGFGPMISVPVKALTSLFAELQPQYADEMLQTQRSLLGDIGAQQASWKQLMPTQIRRALSGLGANLRIQDEWVLETYASSTMSAIAALFATGQGIDPSASPDQRQQFIDRVKNHSRIHTAIKALWGFVVPGTPQIFESTESAFSLEALTGAGLENPAAVFGQAFRNYIEIYGIEEGTFKFLEDYPDATLESIVYPEAYTVSKSQTVTGAPLPATEVALTWYGDNARWLADFPNAGVWLVPDKGNNDETSRFAFAQQFISQMRIMRTPEEFLNQLLFKNAAPEYFALQETYDEMREQYKDNYEVLQVLENEYNKQRELILASNPVFAEMLSTNKSEQRQETMRQLRIAVNDPAAPDSPYLEPIRELVAAYDMFDITLKDLGDGRDRGTLQKKETVRLVFENWVATWLNANPELEALWQSVYEPESNLR